MPRPRFENLDAEKRHEIYEVAARAFAEHGYEGASLNQILVDAGLSKGAAYYYFDDKLDFYISTVLYYLDQLLGSVNFELFNPEPGTYWARIKALYTNTLVQAHQQPWVFGIIQTAWKMPPEQQQANERLAAYVANLEAQTRNLITVGQTHGLVRKDLPQSLIVAMVFGLDSAADEWFTEHWDTLSAAEVKDIAQRIADTLEKMLRP